MTFHFILHWCRTSKLNLLAHFRKLQHIQGLIIILCPWINADHHPKITFKIKIVLEKIRDLRFFLELSYLNLATDFLSIFPGKSLISGLQLMLLAKSTKDNCLVFSFFLSPDKITCHIPRGA